MQNENRIVRRECPKCKRTFIIKDDGLAQASAQSKDWYCLYPGCRELAEDRDKQERK